MMTPHLAADQPEVYWRYSMPPNPGAKMFLLTKGKTAIIGPWYGAYGQHLIAWSPMLKRDKEKEAELGFR